MTTQMQQAREIFAEAEITPSGDPVTKEEEVLENDAQDEEGQGNDEVHAEEEAGKNEEENAEEQEEVAEASDDIPDSYTPDTLAEAIGFETSELYEVLKIPMKDGQDPISLGEIKTKFTDINRENDTLKTQLTDTQGQLELAKSGGPVGINNEVAQAQAYVQQLQARLGNEEMTDLKDIDPTRYLIERDEINGKIQEAHTYINQLGQKQQADQNALLEGYKSKYVELIPSWSDADIKAKDQTIMTNYMKSKGWNDTEISQMIDPRIQVIIKELIDLRSEKDEATKAVLKVRKAPTVISSSRKAPKVNKSDKTSQLVNKARKTNSKRDQLNAARAIMGGSQFA